MEKTNTRNKHISIGGISVRKQYVYAGIAVLLVIAGIWYMMASNSGKQESVTSVETGVNVGNTVPAFTLNSLAGQPVTIAKSDKVTILNFWATWCPPCREEMPELNRFVQNNGQTVAFYAINLQEPAEKVNDFINKNQYTMTVLLDKDGMISNKFQIKAIPTTIIIDKAGIIKYRKSGGVTASELEGAIKGM